MDRAVWEFRRYCTVDGLGFLKRNANASCGQEVDLRKIELREGFPPDKYYLPDGFLEKIVTDGLHPARAILLWQNAFLGFRVRRKVRLSRQFRASNAPLFVNPEILDEVRKYVHIPKVVEDAYRSMQEEAAETKGF